jgi:AraC family transcriptional activator of pobA
MKKHPVYEIKNFSCCSFSENIYVNKIENHIRDNPFTTKLHSHSFFLIVYFTGGQGIHLIDYKEYEIKEGSFFVLQPGQIHSWTVSEAISGYIIFITKEIYNLYFNLKKIENYPIFSNSFISPQINSNNAMEVVTLFQMILKTYAEIKNKKYDKLLNLIDCLFFEIDGVSSQENIHNLGAYQSKISQFQKLIDEFYKTEKSPLFYSKKMNITTKHLNRICKTNLDKTATMLIYDRVILEAKRLLVNADLSINEIADSLGYLDNSHFSNFFKKNTKITASEFRDRFYLYRK